MLPPVSFVPLDRSNREHINNVIRFRWRKYRLTLAISLVLPIAALGFPLVCAFIYGFVILFNAIYANDRFNKLLADQKGGEKIVIPFHPYHYCIPEVGRYYIRTNIIECPYIPIDEETYFWMDSSQVLYMEMAPESRIIFNIRADDVTPPGETDPILQTPSQIKQ